MRPEIYQLDQNVRFADCDASGIVYFGQFSSYFDESVISALREHAITWGSNSEDLGIILPIVEAKAQFFQPLRAGDDFKVLMAVVKLGDRSLKTQHMIISEQDGHPILIASGYISRVCVDARTFKPTKLKEPLKRALKSHYLSPDAWQEFVVKMKERQRR